MNARKGRESTMTSVTRHVERVRSSFSRFFQEGEGGKLMKQKCIDPGRWPIDADGMPPGGVPPGRHCISGRVILGARS